MSDTDDIPQLSADTLAALSMFQAEQQEKIEQLQSGIIEKIDEDWQLSQFWYDDETSRKLVAEGVAAALEGSEARPARIGCVSSPTLVKFFHETEVHQMKF